jgi:ubiquinone/menaquinone biosynthesis C-methylase UbiE
MIRRPTLELLDTDSGTPAEVAGSIRDLRWFNRWFGGIATSRKLIARIAQVTGRREFSLLEVAAGEGYVPEQVRADLEHSGIRLNVTLLDRVFSHLPKNGAVPKVGGDALALPFRQSAFDLVSCSLFAHHLPPEQLVAFGRESLRVCGIAVLVNDLVRHPLHLAIAYAGVPLYRSRLTRHDAPASVRQAYTVEEMRQLWLQAGAEDVELTRHYLFRMGVIAWKQNPKVQSDI